MYAIPFLDLPPMSGAQGTVQLPGSKSISNRLLLLAALSAGTTQLIDLLDSDDTRVMLAALQALGCTTERTHSGQSWLITGMDLSLQRPQTLDLFLGNAGTAMRPLTAALAVMGVDCVLRGVDRMHERPIGDLVDALRALGCTIDYLGQPGFPPLRVGPAKLDLNRAICVRGDVSSQFLTALLMALPLAAKHQPITIDVVGELISKPYIDITLNLLARFGIQVQREGWSRFVIPANSHYQSPGSIPVEADASSASYFIALGAIADGHGIRINGVGAQSIQGDIHFVDAVQRMGAHIISGPNWLQIQRGAWPLHSIDLDCNHIPDAAMTLAVMALYADGPSTLRNIASWRVKETDRIAAMATEARKLGAQVEEGSDWLRIHPLPIGQWQAASLDTYDDHRVAMCFSLAAFNPDQVMMRIQDPKCVGKTFPDYFETLFSIANARADHIPVICIDGPTASGKGSLAHRVAQALGYHYLDSGALYRLTALAAQQAGLTLQATQAPHIAAIAATLPVRFEGERVWLDNQDVSDIIRTEQAGMNASVVSAMPAVRAALVDLQHRFRALPGLVADGRDMGTVIFPNADLKIYLTADAWERARRRHRQLAARGIEAKISDLHADLMARDARDTQRSNAPLKPAQDALLLDNSQLDLQACTDWVLKQWQSTRPQTLG